MKLYVLNSPSYVEVHPIHTLGKSLIDDPLSEHFTYVYYNLLKYGLVDEVVLFPRKGKHDSLRSEIITEIKLPEDSRKAIKLCWSDKDAAIDIINNDKNSYTYMYSEFNDFYKLKNTFTLFNPVTLTTNSQNNLNKKIHNYALIEGKKHEDVYQVVPSEIPRSICPLTTNQFTNLNVEKIQKKEKIYDWIIISALDPRKRHIEFLSSISTHPNFKNLKGCIVARNPDNRDYKHDAHLVLSYLNENFVKKFKNIDIVFNANNEEKIDLLSKSKIFVCVSKFDSGPRALVEAIQAGLPIFTMPQIGCSDWVESGKNGEYISDISQSTQFYKMLSRYDNNSEFYYNNCRIVAENIKPDNVYPQIIQGIKSSNENFH
jgi:glycosyltransferase involved in cell wall biosynthesis